MRTLAPFKQEDPHPVPPFSCVSFFWPGKSIAVKGNFATVAEIADFITKQESIPADQQRLIFAGRQLEVRSVSTHEDINI